MRGANGVWLPVLLISIAALVYLAVLPRILGGTVGLVFPIKLGISALLIAPFGFVMGMPFPTALRAMAPGELSVPDEEMGVLADGGGVEWAWALNAASSVLGSVLAMFLAIQWGLSVVMACAALCYGVAALLSRSFAAMKIAVASGQ